MDRRPIIVGSTIPAMPGDEFTFTPPKATDSYRIEVLAPTAKMTIGVFAGEPGDGSGVARNAAGKRYVDHKYTDAQLHVVTVKGPVKRYQVKATRNRSWLEDLFSVFASKPAQPPDDLDL